MAKIERVKRRVEEAVGDVLGHGRRFPGEAIAELQRCVIDELQADGTLAGLDQFEACRHREPGVTGPFRALRPFLARLVRRLIERPLLG
ncbi:MAG TPA: hypothetical protein VGO70_06050 [Arsenicitalea sp.]|jgi:hypothetical protein|nr:hypothetical protein [Arsenicitalea sp.]